MDFNSLDDASIVRLIAHKHSEALGVLYDRYGKLAYSIAYHTVGNKETSEEIVQDVFTRIWEKAATYDLEQAKVSTWLVSITRNRAIDELRKTRTRPEMQNLDWQEMPELSGPPEAGPEWAAENRWQQETVRKAVASLPPDQRQVLALAYFKGYSHSEIAELLGEPLGTVKARIRQAMLKLRVALSETATKPEA